MECPSDDELLDYASGRLSAEARGALYAHVDGCEACQEILGAVGQDDAETIDLETAGPRRVEALERGSKLGRYVILEPVGRGGMGEVYAAIDPQLDRRIALKVLRSAPQLGPRSEGHSPPADLRLLREAQAMARLSHPNVIAVHDVGTFHGNVFLAMELVDGSTLSAWLKQRHSAAEVLRVFLEAGEGLCAAHAAGLVHRDFKPQNVLMGADGRVRVTDFGLARSTYDGDGAKPLRLSNLPHESETVVTPLPLTLGTPFTATGLVAGTPGYMAPEVLKGKEATLASDQFSFCAALFEGLYGKLPFTHQQLMAARPVQAQVPRVAEVPEAVRKVLEKGLAADPADRFSSLRELLSSLEEPSATHSPRRTARPVIAAGLALAASLLAAAALWGLRTREPAAAPSPPASPTGVLSGEEELQAGITETEHHRFALARGHLERATALMSRPARAQYYVAIVLWWTAAPEVTTLRWIEDAQRGDLPEAQQVFLEGLKLLVKEDWAKATEYFSAAARQFPDSRDILYGCAEALYHSGRADEGIAMYRRAADMSPPFTVGLFHAFDHCSARGDVECLQWVLAREGTRTPEYDIWRAKAPFSWRDYAVAEDVARSSLAGARPDTDARTLLLTHQLVATLMVRGKWSEAGAVVKELAAALPQEARHDQLMLAAARGDIARRDALWSELVDEGAATLEPAVRAGTAMALALFVLPDGDAASVERVRRELQATQPTSTPPGASRLAFEAFVAGALKDSGALAPLQSSPHPEPAAIAGAWAQALRGQPAEAVRAWARARAETSDGRFLVLEAFLEARAARDAGDSAGVLSACGEVLAPRVFSATFSVAVAPCLEWSAAASSGLGKTEEAAAFQARLDALRAWSRTAAAP